MKKKLTQDQKRAKIAKAEGTALFIVITAMAVISLVMVLSYKCWWHLFTVAALALLALLQHLDNEEGERTNWRNY